MALGSQKRGNSGCEVGGGNHRAPTKPLTGEKWPECPITGLRFQKSKGVWQKGRRVHPLAAKKLAYREPIDTSAEEESDDPSDPPAGTYYLTDL